MFNRTILDNADPEIVNRMTTDRNAVSKVQSMGDPIASAPVVAFGALAHTHFGAPQQLPDNIVDVLNFALTLEFLENDFYAAALGSENLIPAETRAIFTQIGKHEAAHVALLQGALGGRAIKKPRFDVTARGKFRDVLKNYQTFLAVSQALEDTGVRAYKGQAGNLVSNDKILTTALQIHSVEARHAAEVRRIRATPRPAQGWIAFNLRGSGLPKVAQPVYDGEENLTQGGANLAGLAGLPDAVVSEAFDEPLTKEQVLEIAKLFIR